MERVSNEAVSGPEDDQFLKTLIRLLDEVVELNEQLERLDSEFRETLDSRRPAGHTG